MENLTSTCPIVSPRQTQLVYRIENAGLRVLELMKMLVHQHDFPRGAGLRVSILGFADDDDRRRSERGERRQQVCRKLSWALVGVSGEFREAFPVDRDDESETRHYW